MNTLIVNIWNNSSVSDKFSVGPTSCWIVWVELKTWSHMNGGMSQGILHICNYIVLHLCRFDDRYCTDRDCKYLDPVNPTPSLITKCSQRNDVQLRIGNQFITFKQAIEQLKNDDRRKVQFETPSAKCLQRIVRRYQGCSLQSGARWLVSWKSHTVDLYMPRSPIKKNKTKKINDR